MFVPSVAGGAERDTSREGACERTWEAAHVSDDFDRDYDFEHGWEALAGLAGRMSTRLQTVQGTNDYAPVGPWEVVPVEPCPRCRDGGLRTAGYVTRDHTLLAVRQCDTCHALVIGSQIYLDDGADHGRADDAEGREDDEDGDWDDGEDDPDDTDWWRPLH